MKKRSFGAGRSAFFLAVMGILAKLIGALYRVPLTNTVGAVGMGLYQTVFPVYTVLLAFCGGGMTTAMSRVVAKYTAVGDDVTAVRTVRVALLPLVTVSLAAAVFAVIFRNGLSAVQGNPEAGICYLALAPSLLFTGGIGVIRGYFQGRSKMTPGGVSQLIEQVVKLGLGLYLAKLLLPHGVKYAVAGALLGVTAGELFALVYLAVVYFAAKRRDKRTPVTASEADAFSLSCADKNTHDVAPMQDTAIMTETAEEFGAVNASAAAGARAKVKNAVLRFFCFGKSMADSDVILLRELVSFAVPIMLGSLVLPVTQMIDSVTVVNILVSRGLGREDATALFGLSVGPIATLINMPTVVLGAVSVAFLPALTGEIERGGNGARLMRGATEAVLTISLPVAVAFFAFPRELISALYSRGLTPNELGIASTLLRIQAVNILYIGILQPGTAVLQARGKARLPVINLAIGAAVKIVLTVVLTRRLGIVGASAATVACYAVAATLTTVSAYKTGGFFARVGALIFPLLMSALGATAFFAVSVAVANTAISPMLGAAAETAAFAVSYFGGLAAVYAVKRKRQKR